MRKTCEVEGCGSLVLAKGLCASHYNSHRLSALRAKERARERQCQRCGATFVGRRPNAIYCSPECKERARGPRPSTYKPRPHPDGVVCPECGASLAGRRPDTRFCSRRCWRTFHDTADLVAHNESRLCRSCGGPMPLDASRARVFCSSACRLLEERARKYGISAKELSEILERQGNACVICGDNGRPLHVDHCHAGGFVRGLLCSRCNNGLGLFRDDPVRLRAAADYLDR